MNEIVNMFPTPAYPARLTESPELFSTLEWARVVDALLTYLDRSMPAEVLFVNMELDDNTGVLVVSAACGFNGESLELSQLAHVDSILRLLGTPDFHFDADRLICTVDGDEIWGWERHREFGESERADAHAELKSAVQEWAAQLA